MIESIGEVDEQTMISFVEGHELTMHEIIAALAARDAEPPTDSARHHDDDAGAVRQRAEEQGRADLCSTRWWSILPSPDDVPPMTGTNPKTNEEEPRKPTDEEPFSALAFKIVTDPHMGRLAYFRVYSGKLVAGSSVYNSTREKTERVSRIMQMHANQREEVAEVAAGGIAAMGLKMTTTGDTLCDAAHPIILESITFPEPVIHIAVEPKTKDDQDRMGEALAKLAEEDPSFRMRYDQETGQTIISGMGELHLDVIVDRMKREFRVEANVGKPEVAYKEAIKSSAKAEGRFVRQTGGHGQFGVARVEIEPLRARRRASSSSTRSSAAKCRSSSSSRSKTACAARSRAASWRATRSSTCACTLIGGDYHDVDSSEMAFKTAGSMAFQAAMEKATPVLHGAADEARDQHAGGVLRRRAGRRHARGAARSPRLSSAANLKVIRALVPLAETFGYATDLRSLTQGRASYSMEFDHYEEVPAERGGEDPGHARRRRRYARACKRRTARGADRRLRREP